MYVTATPEPLAASLVSVPGTVIVGGGTGGNPTIGAVAGVHAGMR